MKKIEAVTNHDVKAVGTTRESKIEPFKKKTPLMHLACLFSSRRSLTSFRLASLSLARARRHGLRPCSHANLLPHVQQVEYFLKEHFDALGLGAHKEFIHFALTSQDVNNVAQPLMLRDAIQQAYLPTLKKLIGEVKPVSTVVIVLVRTCARLSAFETRQNLCASTSFSVSFDKTHKHMET